MKIETKFDVNNLVIGKYQRNTKLDASKNNVLMCMEVIDIKTGTCMAGTQVFYDLRAIHGFTESKYDENGKKSITFVDFCTGSTSKGEYITMREDELVEAPQEIIDIVLGSK